MDKTGKTFASTRYQHLYRHKSGVYYARVTVNRKKTWRSLRTRILGVARSELADLLREERKNRELNEALETHEALSLGQVAQKRLERALEDASTKESTKKYQREIHDALFRDWPGLAAKDSAKVTGEDCRKWSVTHRKRFSATRFNASLDALRQTFDLAVEMRLRLANPCTKIKRAKVVTQDLGLILPTPEKFEQLVAEIRRSPSKYAKPCGDWVEFQSYSGLRPDTESPFVTWRHCDFANNELVVTGSKENEGTKNRTMRRVPMNDSLRRLLETMREGREDEPMDTPVLQVTSARGAIRRAVALVDTPYLRPYDLRHLFATRCLESGVDVPTVADWLGHKDKGALLLKTYTHIRNLHSQAAAKKVSF